MGNFDGVHAGHRYMLHELVRAAREEGLLPAAMTFEPHPLAVLRPSEAPPRIDDLRGKARKLAQCRVARLHVLHFTRTLAAISAREYVHILLNVCGARIVAAGSDFRFGANREGDIGYLRRVAGEAGCRVLQISDYVREGQRVSSKLVREALAGNMFAKAAALLGAPYEIAGRVVRGARVGRDLGFPTANIRFPHKHALRGVYAGWAAVDGGDGLHPCAISAGHRPAVGGGPLTVEAHIIGFGGDLYGKRLALRPVKFLRPEQNYPSAAELAAAIGQDVQECVRVLRGNRPPVTSP